MPESDTPPSHRAWFDPVADARASAAAAEKDHGNDQQPKVVTVEQQNQQHQHQHEPKQQLQQSAVAPSRPSEPASSPTSSSPPAASPHAVSHEHDDPYPVQHTVPDHRDQHDQRKRSPRDQNSPRDHQHAAWRDQPDLHDEHPDHAGIEPAGPEDDTDEDEFALTDGYETASTGSTSVTSSIYAHTYEHGRRYQHFKHGRYPIPNDDEELNREDMKHAMMMELCDGQLFYAPLCPNAQKILDIGTGTGVWAIEVGDQFPNARVRGIDLSPTQPVWVPPNVDFLVDDCEQGEWLDHDADLVHFRFMTIVLKDVPGVLRRAYESLRPGGWLELQELCGEILCDDDTMPDDDPVKYMYELAQRAFTKFGMNVTLPKDLEPMLRDAGFENLRCVVKKVPIGPWARDKTLRIIGMYQKMAVQDLMPALGGRPFTALGMSQIESQVTLARARQGLGDNSVHRYFHYYFWSAQKPST